jgi:hypothetical protein
VHYNYWGGAWRKYAVFFFFLNKIYMFSSFPMYLFLRCTHFPLSPILMYRAFEKLNTKFLEFAVLSYFSIRKLRIILRYIINLHRL